MSAKDRLVSGCVVAIQLANRRKSSFPDEVCKRDGSACIVSGVVHHVQAAHLLERTDKQVGRATAYLAAGDADQIGVFGRRRAVQPQRRRWLWRVPLEPHSNRCTTGTRRLSPARCVLLLHYRC